MAASAFILVLITIFLPPVGVAMIAGCGPDLLINICLTLLGFLPGHIHAFYLEYVYYERRDQARMGMLPNRRAPGVFSEKIQNGGLGGQATQPVNQFQAPVNQYPAPGNQYQGSAPQYKP